MKEKKKRKLINSKNIIIALLLIIIIILTISLIHCKNDKKDDSNENNKNNNQQINDDSNINYNNETNDYKDWMKYILVQKITKLELTKYPCLEDTFEKKTISLDTEELKNIFKKLISYKLRVSYTGGGGWECGTSLKIMYLKDDKEYEVDYLGPEGHIVPSSDGCSNIYDKDFENALNSSVDIKDNKGKDSSCIMYDLIRDDISFDEYFK